MATTTTSRVRAARLLVLVLAVLQPVGSAVLAAVRGLRVAREARVLGHLAVLFTGFNVWLGFAALAA